MFYKGKDTLKEKIALQNKYHDAFRVPDNSQKLLYHYAGIETIWKILENDSFLARNIRFSNDSEEYKLGEAKIKECASQYFSDAQLEQFFARIQHGIQKFYMICFCSDGDLLSQWRGYAKDGVSLGMDFLEEDENPQEHTEMFTILNNWEHQKDDRYQLNGEYVRCVEMPYQVFYVDKEADKKADEESELSKALHCFDDEDARPNMLLNLIPFIKDKGFAEEAEYRILFDISDLGTTEAQSRIIMNRKIEYLEKDNRKLPNIIVEVGDGEKKRDSVKGVILGTAIRLKAEELKMSEDEIEGIYQNIEKELDAHKITCIRSEGKRHIYVEEGKNQEEVMGWIEDVLQKNGIPIDYERGIKIWCRGHLPIREVVVAPGEKKEKIRESLKHYMQNTYWLRYVDVKESKIPLQS